METSSAGRNSEYHDVQPQSPLRPPPGDPFLSPLTPLNSGNDIEPLIQRKPILPKRSLRSSLEKRSYELVEIKPMKSGATGCDYDETSRFGTSSPKSFSQDAQIPWPEFGLLEVASLPFLHILGAAPCNSAPPLLCRQ
jgi:hypothetical protein